MPTFHLLPVNSQNAERLKAKYGHYLPGTHTEVRDNPATDGCCPKTS